MKNNDFMNQIDRLRDDFAGGLSRIADGLRGRGDVSRRDNDPIASMSRWFEGDSYPRVEVENNKDDVIVRAEMPGLEKDEFNVEVDQNRLNIRGERRCQTKEQKPNYVYQECSYGSFSRSISLPAEVEPEKTKADYKNGVLTITLPKSPRAKSHKVNVQV